MTWLPETAPGRTPLDRVFGLRPVAYERFRELYAGLWDASVIDPALLELCRLRIATLLGCDAELRIRHGGARLDEARVAALAAWPTSPLFGDAERSCLAFAEQYVLDPSRVTDADFGALRRHLDPPAIATLTLAVAVFDALARLRLGLGVASAGEDLVTVSEGTPESLP